ncbi:MAG: hypothetical protein KBT27_11725 [Prevotellaceae bacterium]|nr:hypothetical protein [Candidatus Faecinaster equi]
MSSKNLDYLFVNNSHCIEQMFGYIIALTQGVGKMKDTINNKYNDLYANSLDFRIFVEKMEKYSTDEIIALYGAKLDIIYYLVET